MKRIILLSLLFLAGFILPAFSSEDEVNEDTSNKVVVESLEDFSFENNDNIVKFKAIEENTFKNGITFEKDSIICAKVTKVIEPKRGKRNGYLIVDPKSYTVPSKGGETVEINDEYWVAKVLGFKPFNVKDSAVGAGLAVAGHFVKGIGQFYYFGKGIVSPNEGEGRLKSGVKNVYENSPLAYIEEGEEVNINKGDLLLLKFHYDNVPKWKFWQRNK